MTFPFFESRFFARFIRQSSIEEFIRKYFGKDEKWRNSTDQVKILVTLINLVRPKTRKSEAGLDELLTALKNNPVETENIGLFIRELISSRNFKSILTDAAIIDDTHFLKEVKRRFIAKLLPYQPKKNTLEYVLNQVFFSSTDPKWINSIEKEQKKQLFELLNCENIFHNIGSGSAFLQLFESIEILLRRINGRVMETDVLKMVPEYASYESPFVALENEMVELRKEIFDNGNPQLNTETLVLRQFLVLHKQCEAFIDDAFHNSAKFGISMKVNQNLLRVKQQLQRLKQLLQLLTVNKEADLQEHTIELSRLLIEFNCSKNNIRKLVDESTQLISYEITQHTAKTGEHYITQNKSEYIHMLKASMGGGLIVGLMCIVKVFLGKVDVSDFGHALLYSANYAVGFIAIYLLGFTLATKQPAMTASKFIQELKKGLEKGGKSKNKYDDFAVMFSKLFRSQFIAFVGNVFIAFPIALLGIWVIELLFGYTIPSTKADKLISDISPIHSLAIFHAAIAGIFLFLSGIISGSIANRDRHLHVPYRIKEHPLLKLSLGKKKTNQIAAFYEKKWAGIMSNLWFGVFMGSTASIGAFIGLNLDVRHITFAGGNFALGLYGSEFVISGWMIFWAIIGIGIIGLINFLVSFVLSLLLAFRSRKIPFSEVRLVFSSNWQYFKKHPLSFFFPLETKKSAD